MKDFFFIAFHFAVQAIPIVLLIDNKAINLKTSSSIGSFNHFESWPHALVHLATWAFTLAVQP